MHEAFLQSKSIPILVTTNDAYTPLQTKEVKKKRVLLHARQQALQKKNFFFLHSGWQSLWSSVVRCRPVVAHVEAALSLLAPEPGFLCIVKVSGATIS